MEDYNVTLKYLLSLKTENEWLEYKENNSDPNLIGEYISALCNSAILEGQDKAYLIYGISDDKQIVGTKFDFKKAKYKQQELENYIQTLLSPRITFSIHDLNFEDDIRVQIIEIETTNVNVPVKYKDVEYIRVNSTKQKLKDFPEKERKLWKCFESKIFETQIIMSNVAKEDIFDLLDYDTYFNLMNIKHNLNKEYILEKLIEEDFVVYKRGTYNITYLGAIVLAKDLNKFKEIKSRAPRVVVYDGNNKFNTLSDITGNKGYAVAFENLIDYINDKALNKEIIGDAFRKTEYQYPKIAIRETVANALVHQDFMEGNKGPLIEIYSDRIEITNSGKPLIDTKRFIDHTPKSRNEKLANIMRLLRICEEKGSGVDKVITSIEEMNLPAPEYEEYEDSIRVIIYAHKEYAKMTEEERVRATYQHCCLKYVNKEFMTNTTLRERFRIDKNNSSTVSRLISLAIEKNVIKDFDPDGTTKKFKKYIPYWA